MAEDGDEEPSDRAGPRRSADLLPVAQAEARQVRPASVDL